MTAALNLPRIVAAAFALGGAIMMMIEPAPNWTVVAIGVLCLLMFTSFSVVSWLLPAPRLKRKRYRRSSVEMRSAREDAVEVRELLPSRLPELSTHIERRRFRGKYRTE